MSLSLRPVTPLEPEDEIRPSSSSLEITAAPADISDQEPRPPSPKTTQFSEEDSPSSPRDFEMNGLEDFEREPRAEEEEPQTIEPEPRTDEEEPRPDEEEPRPDEEEYQSDEEEPPPPPDSDEDSDEEEWDSSDEDDLLVTREDMKTTLQFIQILKDATLDTQFSPKELEAFRNPQAISSSPSDDPDLLLSISNYVANLNASQDIYIKNRLNTQRRDPNIKMLSYDQVQRRVSKLSGVVTWQHDMCVDSCVGFTGPYADLEHCPHPRCGKPRYDPHKLEKSGGKIKVPQKSFTTFPVGPQLQSRWKSPSMAQKMHYRRNKTADLFRECNEGTRDGYDDILGGYAYLEAVESGKIKEHNTVLMLSMDGAQLLRNKKSNCWIYIWILLDLAPDQRYKVRNILPGGIIPGPEKPKDIDSFLLPSLAHVSALQKEGLHIWDGYDSVAVISFLFLLLILADAVAMAKLSGSVGHHGKRGCRLLCAFYGRNKPSGSHYYPVLLKPLDSVMIFAGFLPFSF